MRKLTIILATCVAVTLAALVGCNKQSSSAPEADFSERKQLFDFDWKFALGDFPEASQQTFDDASWRALDLPHDWSIEGITNADNPSGNDGGYFPAGIGWYRKTFSAPESWKGKELGIYFEGVYMDAEVFLNGVSLGKRPYGYSSFYYDLTPHLHYGQKNLISVRVDNSQQKNSRWYNGSGIYRHVWLSEKNPVHIKHWGVSITTPEVSNAQSTVRIVTKVSNQTASNQELTVATQLTFAQDASAAGDNAYQVTLPANSEAEVVQTINVANPKLWSPNAPNLYQAKIDVRAGDKLVDQETQTFGIRSIAFSTEKGFELNGEKLTIYGGSVHHDNGALGAKAFDRAEERRVELLKAAGFNAVRTSHNPPSEAFLRACDRVGLLVIDEAFDGWRELKTPHDYSARFFDTWWKQDLQTMIERDRNHPSIIMWSIGNEIIERTKPSAVDTAKQLAALVHELDPTRPVTSAMTTWNEGWEIFDPLFAAHDIGGYNYQLHEAPSDHKRVPSRIIVQTESYPKDAFANWQLVNDNPYIIGDFVWTAMDYLGESGIGRYYYPGEPDGEHWEKPLFPWHGAYCGDVDLIGWRKPISHYRSMLFNESEKLYMAVREPNPKEGDIKLTMWAVWPTWESWTWPGQEGKALDVEIYSKYPAVRLYKDDQLIGEQQTTRAQEFKATFAVPYSPGQLRAVGVVDGKEVESFELNTAGDASAIALHADRTSIKADGEDLSFVTIEITDANGLINPNAENELSFTLEGPGVIEAVSNANLRDTDSYVGNKRKAWKGQALVVIKSTRDAGDITLSATAPGLADAKVVIKSAKQ